MHNAYVSRVAMMDIFSCSTQSSCVKLQQNTVKNVIPCNTLYVLTTYLYYYLFTIFIVRPGKRKARTKNNF